MKTIVCLAVLSLLASVASAAEANPKEAVLSAAKSLGEKPNYSWRTTVVVPESARWRPGPTEGKTEKAGLTCLSITFGDNTTQAVLKGDKGAVTSQDGGWQSLSELENSEGPGRFFARMYRGFKVPAAQAAEIADATKSLAKEGDVYAGELTEDGAKALVSFRRGADAPPVSAAKGSAKFWIKDGVLTKFQFKVQGKMEFNGNEIEVDRDTTVEIKDVGNTKLEVPEAATKKLS